MSMAMIVGGDKRRNPLSSPVCCRPARRMLHGRGQRGGTVKERSYFINGNAKQLISADPNSTSRQQQ